MQLNRYTSVPALLRVLEQSALTLISPMTWADTNDIHAMAVYKQRMELRSLLALCFTSAAETYHHWHVFAADGSGVRIGLDGNLLLASMWKADGFLHGSVKYFALDQLRDTTPKVQDLPFIKRIAFSDEREYRLLFQHKQKEVAAVDLPLKQEWIKEIVFSPRMPEPLAKTLKNVVLSLLSSARPLPKIYRSSLTAHKEWKKLISRVAPPEPRSPYVLSFEERLNRLY